MGVHTTNMDHEVNIKEELGESIFNLLRDEIRNGKVHFGQIRRMATLMHKNVHGVFVHNEGRSDGILDLFNQMLDEWYKCELYLPDVKSKERLFEILNHCDIRMGYLVHTMREKIREEEEEEEEEE